MKRIFKFFFVISISIILIIIGLVLFIQYNDNTFDGKDFLIQGYFNSYEYVSDDTIIVHFKNCFLSPNPYEYTFYRKSFDVNLVYLNGFDLDEYVKSNMVFQCFNGKLEYVSKMDTRIFGDAGYGDIKQRTDGTLVIVSYFSYNDSGQPSNKSSIVQIDITKDGMIKKQAIVVDADIPLFKKYSFYARPYLAINPLNTSEWLMSFTVSQGHLMDVDFMATIRSYDEGCTWGDVQMIPVDAGNCTSESMLIPFSDGNLLFHVWTRADKGGTTQLRSHDFGRTWFFETSNITIPGITEYLKGVQSYFIVNDTLYISFETYPKCEYSFLAVSYDQGYTYNLVSMISSPADRRRLYEPGIVYTGNQSIVCILRPYKNGIPYGIDDGHTFIKYSSDLGMTWSTLSEITNQIGTWERARLIYDGTCIYGMGTQDFHYNNDSRDTNRTVALYWSDDKGITWESTFYLWCSKTTI